MSLVFINFLSVIWSGHYFHWILFFCQCFQLKTIDLLLWNSILAMWIFEGKIQFVQLLASSNFGLGNTAFSPLLVMAVVVICIEAYISVFNVFSGNYIMLSQSRRTDIHFNLVSNENMLQGVPTIRCWKELAQSHVLQNRKILYSFFFFRYLYQHWWLCTTITFDQKKKKIFSVVMP